MIKTTYSTMLLALGFLALMLMMPSAQLNAAPIGDQNNSPASPVSNVNRTDIGGLNQLESPLLIAQTTEEHRSSESSSNSTTETPPAVQENRSSESSSHSTVRTTTEAPPEHCAKHCSDRYKHDLVECNAPHHPHHGKCEKWARESEQECLASCK